MRPSGRMKADWDARARADAMHYIGFRAGGHFQSPAEFYKKGETMGPELMRPIMDKLGFDPSGGRVLEIGCGMGRLFPGFRRLGFAEIWGTDVSPEMTRLGSEFCPVQDAHFLALDDEALKTLPVGYYDYVFSYTVFQHIPDPDVVWSYLRAVRRLLRNGGCFQLQFMTQPNALYPLMNRLPESVHRPISFVADQISALRHGRPPERGFLPGSLATWGGARLDAHDVRTRLVELGFSGVEIVPDASHPGKHSWWAIGRK